MTREIGSEFWNDCTPLNGCGLSGILPDNHILTLSGRTALDVIIQDLIVSDVVRSICFPSYYCHSMVEPFLKNGIDVHFYPVYFGEKGIDFDIPAVNCDAVYLIDFFGYKNCKTDETAQAWREAGKVVIYDATHSLFNTNIDYRLFGYSFGSIRKWFGINAGFCSKSSEWVNTPALSANKEYSKLRNEAFINKSHYMTTGSGDKSVFRDMFSRAEDILDHDYVNYGIDDESQSIITRIDADFIRSRRRQNAQKLISALSNNKTDGITCRYFELSNGDCPLFVPLYVNSEIRADLRAYLCENNIYLPVHWPIEDTVLPVDISREIFDTELSCVCDQRYSEEDMDRILDTLSSYSEERNV